MGSPLSPLLAEIFMSDFEEKFLNTSFAENIFFWYRYVDDILVCFTGNNIDLQYTLNHLNSIHPKIKFTVEKEKESSINFLDLSINRGNNEFSFNIYRKPTFTDTTIPQHSVHPISHKLSSYRSMIHRAFTIPLDDNTRTIELNTIKQIATNNGFKLNTIQSLINKKQKQMVLNCIYPRTHLQTTKNRTINIFWTNFR